MNVSLKDTTIDGLKAIRFYLIEELEEVDRAIANAGGEDLVTWAGTASYEQRCGRCGYWIFNGDKVASIIIAPSKQVYVHREHVVRIPQITKEEPRD